MAEADLGFRKQCKLMRTNTFCAVMHLASSMAALQAARLGEAELKLSRVLSCRTSQSLSCHYNDRWYLLTPYSEPSQS